MAKKIFSGKLYCTTVQNAIGRGNVMFSDILPGSNEPGKPAKQPGINIVMQVKDPKGKSDFEPGKQYTFTINED